MFLDQNTFGAVIFDQMMLFQREKIVAANHWWEKISDEVKTSHIDFQIKENKNLLLHFLIKSHFLNQKTFGAMIFDQKIIFQVEKICAANH